MFEKRCYVKKNNINTNPYIHIFNKYLLSLENFNLYYAKKKTYFFNTHKNMYNVYNIIGNIILISNKLKILRVSEKNIII